MILGRFLGFFLPADPETGRIAALQKQLAATEVARDEALRSAARLRDRAQRAEQLAADRLAELEQSGSRCSRCLSSDPGR